MYKSVQWHNHALRILKLGNDYLFIRSGHSTAVMDLGNAIHQKRLPFIEEVVVSEREIGLKINKEFPNSLDWLEQLKIEKPSRERMFSLPVCFSGHGDWDIIINHSKLNRSAIESTIGSTTFTLAMFGFLPGFLYLDGLPKELHVPRKSNPSTKIDKGTVAIGGKYLGVYALDSPGGWNVIGKTPLRLLEKAALPPTPVHSGDLLRIEPISTEQFQKLSEQALTLVEYNARS
jgi:KipI family sensor histidine kinase inhibitor